MGGVEQIDGFVEGAADVASRASVIALPLGALNSATPCCSLTSRLWAWLQNLTLPFVSRRVFYPTWRRAARTITGFAQRTVLSTFVVSQDIETDVLGHRRQLSFAVGLKLAMEPVQVPEP